MFTRKTEKTPSPDSEIFNNRLNELKTPVQDEARAHPELSEFSSEPLPLPEKLKKRTLAEHIQEPATENLEKPVSQSQADSSSDEQNRSSRETVISNDLIIEGSVTSQGVIRLEGTVHGDLHCSALVVETAGAVSGNVKADTVNVHGRVEGTIHGDSVMLHSTAFVEGDIFHQGIGIEMGTHYDGRLQWVDAQQASAPLAHDQESMAHPFSSQYLKAAE